MTIAKIKKALKARKLNIKNVETIIMDCGYTVIYFNTPMGDSEISRYYLDTEKATLKAFTYYENARIVFVDNNLHTEDKLYLLLHELGHIVLEHLEENNIMTKNTYLMDIEADNFAYSIIYRDNKVLVCVLLSAVLISISVLTAGMINATKNTVTTYNNVESSKVSDDTEIPVTNSNPETATESEVESEFVYVTPSGNKFHRADCYYIKNRTTTELSRTKAATRYAPCAVCEP